MTFEEWWESMPKSVPGSKRDIADMAWQAAQPKWQPIETAPKDGSTIILCENESFAGYWEDTRNYFCETGWYPETYRYGSHYSEHPFNPTHWMPLPEPPNEQ